MNRVPAPWPEACDTLLGCLADEQSALDGLLFKLKEQQLVLSSGEHRWLARTSHEITVALAALEEATRRREGAAAAANSTLGLPGDANLAQAADRVTDEATCQRLHQRRRSLRDALDQVRRCSRQNREFLAAGLAATGDALALLGAPPTYDSAGSIGAGAGNRPRFLDARA